MHFGFLIGKKGKQMNQLEQSLNIKMCFNDISGSLTVRGSFVNKTNAVKEIK